jgi:glycosyltransferase involved in cell wall biosynthesis
VITATVAICTRNRAELLRRCLTSLASQIAEPGQVEVLVVDNGSTDGTGGVLAAWQRDGEGRRVVEEPRVGLSHARNAALEASDREVVVFADDDALTPTGWARAHLSAYQDPGVGAAGGPVGLLWPGARPSWISDGLAQWYGSLEYGDEPCPFPDPHGPYGVNMSVRRAAARAVGGFDPQLGRSGSRLLSGEEPDLTRRLVAAGWAIRYVPAAGLVHAVTPERIDRRWVLRRGWAQGVTNARLEVLAENPTRAGRVRAALKEASDAHRYWRDRRADGADGADGAELLAQARATAHAAAGLELLRLAVRDVRHDGP